MKQQHDQISVSRNSSTTSSCPSKYSKYMNIIPSGFGFSSRSSSSSFAPDDAPLRNNSLALSNNLKQTRLSLSSFLRSFLSVFSFSSFSFPTCRWLSIPGRALSISAPTSLGRKVTGTLFGHRKGHVTFAIQHHPKEDPALLIELAISTSDLVREMSSGLVRIALECDRVTKHGPTKLFSEPVWTMYCNGKKCGYATSRASTEFDWHVLSTVQSISVGAGVIPLVENGTGSGSKGELLYMRAKFERVIGSRDSEAFYMLNPDSNGGPELSIFLLRL
ncbi:hypothetical protein RND81_14G035700 [Saponaria officinalis]|uniref:Protein MIZU-KUSSEI 1 n=1 Tax=Saponaria officinalis TaxID=3572 RepID=A0AAW1GH79_SAPOF